MTPPTWRRCRLCPCYVTHDDDELCIFCSLRESLPLVWKLGMEIPPAVVILLCL